MDKTLFLSVIALMFFFCLYLFFENENLRKEIKKLKQEITKKEKSIEIKDNIQTISLDKEEQIPSDVNNNINKNTDEQLHENISVTIPTFQKNSNKERENPLETNDYVNKRPESHDNNKLDLNDFVRKSEKIVTKISSPETNSVNLKEISNKIAKEIKPQTIELTDYEKKQEEQAIISYQELLASKGKIMIKDDEEDIKFIEDLKDFRNKLY